MVLGVIVKNFTSVKDKGFCCSPGLVSQGSVSEDSRGII